ncbi:Na+/H+ antiporter NhaA [Paraglaciecola chathamensis]|uniref:Na+/H+ antiporter NhaA n=1 Tax=Paraglaciecola chathamensis TaxID=368405 RepID=UPI002711B552|nr:Na+/H+ antiporter NhaA [Paraglaciecola chathamensis]MDO6559862.1 Na+/H+ antiporter NhaA [Paraglaciecola chathamensis]
MNPLKDRDRELAPLERKFNHFIFSFEQFFKSQATASITLLLAAMAAMFIANSQWHETYQDISHMAFSISLGDFAISYSLHTWVNDGLMVLFFFLLGLEIKYECLVGDLKDFRDSSLVIAMAVGGMLIPACIYAGIAMTGTDVAMRGWGIPMATDTAFALGILALLGSKAPRSAAVTLSALAIVDDMGAVAVIGLFYTENIHLVSLGYAGLTLLGLMLMNLLGFRRPIFYMLGGILLWWFVLQSGVHATAAGILAALAVPTRPYAQSSWFSRNMRSVLNRFEKNDRDDKSILEQQEQHELVEQAQDIAAMTTTPIQRWGHVLNRPVSLMILPIFAFINAGVALPSELDKIFESVVFVAVGSGLVLGKVIGISLFAWFAVKCNFARLPKGLNFHHIIALASLAGVGFTMSLFIASLGFANYPQLLAQAKLGILAGSVIAAIIGTGLFLLIKKEEEEPKEQLHNKAGLPQTDPE